MLDAEHLHNSLRLAGNFKIVNREFGIHFCYDIQTLVTLDPYFDCDGHLLLDALALSAASGIAFELDEIRAFEAKPGLRPHQSAAVQLARTMCSAEAEVSSRKVRFTPGPIRAGDFVAKIETAGPISSVLQAAMIPAILAPGPVQLTVTGGTDVLYRPNVSYVEQVLCPYYRMFADVEMKVERRGTFPGGGGRVVVRVDNQRLPPAPDLQSNPKFEQFRLQVVGGGIRLDETLEALKQKLQGPVQVEHLDPDANVLSLCLWAESNGARWPGLIGSWSVGERSRGGKFGQKLAADLRQKLDSLLYDPRVELLSWLAGAPIPATVSQDSNELAASKYLARTLPFQVNVGNRG